MNLSLRLVKALAALALLPVCVYAVEPINLRVVWTESPQTKAVVAWDSVGKGKGTLQMREATKGSEVKTLAAKVEAYQKPKEGEITHSYTVSLDGLKPSTKYVVAAEVDADKTKDHYFITAPNTDKEFKIFFAGDSRSRLDKTRAVSKMIKDMLEKDPSYIALLHGGDMANKPSTKDWNRWLRAYSMTTTSDGRLLPIIPVRGNHERRSSVFDQAYGSPGTKNYYTCMLSPQVAIVVLNDNTSAGGGQKEFLKNALSELKKNKVRFQMTAYHRPLYPAIKSPGKAKGTWVPLFEEYNIDLGLESDGHCIKRTVPIRGEKKADDGVVYLGEGGYGAPQRTSKKDHWYLKKPGFLGKGDHVMILSFTKDKIDYYTRDLVNGNVDEAIFKARKR